MDSIKLFLPSNASPHHYPNNEPSNFRIHFDEPLQLEGTWKAGIESVFYPSNIGDNNETCDITLYPRLQKEVFVNEIYPIKFKVNSEAGLYSFGPYYPESFEKDPKNIDGIIKTLNAMNDIFTFGKAFSFHRNDKNIYYRGYYDDLFIRITPAVARCLRFAYTFAFGGKGATNSYWGKYDKELTKEDYELFVFDKNILQKERRIILKMRGKSYTKLDNFKKFMANKWKKTVSEYYDSEVKFNSKGTKMILTYNLENKAMIFSNDMKSRFFIPSPIFKKGEFWGVRNFASHDDTLEEWYVDIYSQKLEKTQQYTIQQTNIIARPNMFLSVSDALADINTKISSNLREMLARDYDENKHKADFSIKWNCANLILGPQMRLKISTNLMRMLGFETSMFNNGSYKGNQMPLLLRETQQQLQIVSDFIQPVSYGSRKLYTMEHFVHNLEEKQDLIVKKRFFPMAYYPVSRNNISSIHVRIVDSDGRDIKMTGGKTLLIVHFIREK